MAGGLMQLVAYGAQDVYLTSNPQITFFKVVYRRHTNFAMEVIERSLIGEPDFDKRVTVVMGKDGDLISKMYLKVILASVDPNGNKFAWVRRIGHAIIDEVEVEIGGTKVDRQFGTWLDIWYELARTGDHERGYARMIGDIPELTEFNSEIKDRYVLFIPLQFWFNRHVGLSIPLIALQYHDVRIHVRFSQKESVIIRDANFDDTNVSIENASLLVNYIYLDSEERRRFAQVGHEYLIEQVQFDGIEQSLDLISTYALDYNHPTKEIFWAIKNGTYTSGNQFLFYTSRDSWTEPDFEGSLIEGTNVKKTAINEAACKIITESISIGTNPASIIGGDWETVRANSTSIINTINITNNSVQAVYVNPTSLSIGDYEITSKINADVIINSDNTITCLNIDTSLTVRDLSFTVDTMTDTRVSNNDPIVRQFNNYGILIDGSVNPVQHALLKFNGHDRFDRREGAYFNYVQAEQHHSNTPADGINVYSFALHPEQHQPSGTAGLSRIDDVTLTIWLIESTARIGLPNLNFLNDASILYIYGLNYNILRIMSGLAGIAYSE